MIATLLKADALKFNPLEDVAIDDVPPTVWNGSHAGKRLVEAFQTLGRMPRAGMRRASGLWPAYSYEWTDLLAQQEQADDEKHRERSAANRSRVAPSIEQITRMESALYWPACYLAALKPIGYPSLLIAVNTMAFALAIDRDARWVARRHGGGEELWRRRYWDGCEVIALALIRAKAPVF